MEIKQLNDYKIEFYSEKEYYKEPYRINDETGSLKDYLYCGLCSNINEELAEKIVGYNGYYYTNYKTSEFRLKTAKQSFKTLSNLPYCVIFKNIE